MRITAITKFKQGDLWQALRRAGWNQADLARECGVTTNTICSVVNLKKRPHSKVADKIQNVFARKGIYLDILAMWPESFQGFRKTLVVEQTRDVDLDCFLPQYEKPLLDVHHGEMVKVLDSILETLSPQQRLAIEGVFLEGKPLAEVGAKFTRSKSYDRRASKANNLIQSGFKVLRNPENRARLAEIYDGNTTKKFDRVLDVESIEVNKEEPICETEKQTDVKESGVGCSGTSSEQDTMSVSTTVVRAIGRLQSFLKTLWTMPSPTESDSQKS